MEFLLSFATATGALLVAALVGVPIVAGILFGGKHGSQGKHHKGWRRNLSPEQEAKIEAKIDAEIAGLRPDIREALEKINITLLVENAVEMSMAKHAMEVTLGKNTSDHSNPVMLSSAELTLMRYVTDYVEDEEEENREHEYALGNWTESLLVQPGVKALSLGASERFGMPYGMPLIYSEKLTLPQMMAGLTRGLTLRSP